jgi:hypothetical protein
MDKDEVQFVYTLSSTREFLKQLIRSVRTLTDYTDPENITVFYTPPHDEEHEQVIRDLGVNLVKQENETEGFSTFWHKEQMGFGEKIKLCDVDAETIVFLDCDTLILGDIFEVIEGDFDFKGRPDLSGVHPTKWKKLFEKHDKEYMDWVPNGGFFIFKNRIHKEIREEWQQFMEEGVDYYYGGNHQEVFALSLAVSEYNLEKMTPKEHVYEFGDENVPDGIVYHMITPNKTFNQVMMAVRRRVPLLEKAEEKWLGVKRSFS